jgi:hypothetical protein
MDNSDLAGRRLDEFLSPPESSERPTRSSRRKSAVEAMAEAVFGLGAADEGSRAVAGAQSSDHFSVSSEERSGALAINGHGGGYDEHDEGGTDGDSDGDDETFSVEAFSDVGFGDTYGGGTGTGGGGGEFELSGDFSKTADASHGSRASSKAAVDGDEGNTAAAGATSLSALRKTLMLSNIGAAMRKVDRAEVGISSAASFRMQKRQAGHVSASEVATRAHTLWRLARRVRLMLRFCLRLTAVSVNPSFHPVHRLVAYLSQHCSERHSEALAAMLAASVDPSPLPPTIVPTSPQSALRRPSLQGPGSIGGSRRSSLGGRSSGGGGGREEPSETTLEKSTKVAATLIAHDRPDAKTLAESLAAARAVAAEACRSPPTLKALSQCLARLRRVAKRAFFSSRRTSTGAEAAADSDEDNGDNDYDGSPPPADDMSGGGDAAANITLVAQHVMTAIGHMAMVGGVGAVRASGLERQLARAMLYWPTPAGEALIEVVHAVQRHAGKLSAAQRQRFRRERKLAAASSSGPSSPSPAEARFGEDENAVKVAEESEARAKSVHEQLARLLLAEDGKRPAPVGIDVLERLYAVASAPDPRPNPAPDRCRVRGGRHIRSDDFAASRRLMVANVLTVCLEQWSGVARAHLTATTTSTGSNPSSSVATSINSATGLRSPKSGDAARQQEAPAAQPSGSSGKDRHVLTKHVKVVYTIAEATLQHAVPDATLESGPHVAFLPDSFAGTPPSDALSPGPAVRLATPTHGVAAASVGGLRTVSFAQQDATPPREAVAETLLMRHPSNEGLLKRPHQQAELPSRSTAAIIHVLETLCLLPEGSYWQHVAPPQSLISRLLDLLVWWPTAEATSQSVAFLLQQLPATSFFADAVARKAPSLGSLLSSQFMPSTAAIALLRTVSAVVGSDAPAVQSFGRELAAPAGPLRARVMQALSVYKSVNEVLVESAATLSRMIRITDQVVPGEPAALARTARDAETADVVSAAVSALVTAASSRAFGGWSAVSSDCSSSQVPIVPAFARAMLAAGQDQPTLDKVLAAMTAASEAAPPADVMGDARTVAQLVDMAAEASSRPHVQEQLLRCAASAAAQAPAEYGAGLETLRTLASIVEGLSGSGAGRVAAAAGSLARHSASRALAASGMLNAAVSGLSACPGQFAIPLLEVMGKGGDDPSWLRALDNAGASSRVLLYASTTALPVPTACRAVYILALCTPDLAAADLLRANPIAAHLLSTEENAADHMNPLDADARRAVDRLRGLVARAEDEAGREMRELREQVAAITAERDVAMEGVKASERRLVDERVESTKRIEATEARLAEAEAAHSAEQGRLSSRLAELELSVSASTASPINSPQSVVRGSDASDPSQPLVARVIDGAVGDEKPAAAFMLAMLPLHEDERNARWSIQSEWLKGAYRVKNLLQLASNQTAVKASIASAKLLSSFDAQLWRLQLDESTGRATIAADSHACWQLAALFYSEHMSSRSGTVTVTTMSDLATPRSVVAFGPMLVTAVATEAPGALALVAGCAAELAERHRKAVEKVFSASEEATSRAAAERTGRLTTEAAKLSDECTKAAAKIRVAEASALSKIAGWHGISAAEAASRVQIASNEADAIARLATEAELGLARAEQITAVNAAARRALVHSHLETSNAVQDLATMELAGLLATRIHDLDRIHTAQIAAEHARFAQAKQQAEVALAAAVAAATAKQLALEQRCNDAERQRDAAKASAAAQDSNTSFLKDQVRDLTEQLAASQRRLDAELAEHRQAQQRLTVLERDNVSALAAAEKVKTDMLAKAQTQTRSLQLLERQVELMTGEAAAAAARAEQEKEEYRLQLKQARGDSMLLRNDLAAERQRLEEAVASAREKGDVTAKLERERDSALSAQVHLTARLETLVAEGRDKAAALEHAVVEMNAACELAKTQAAAAEATRRELAKQLTKNGMLQGDIQHAIAEAHAARAELTYLHQHNLIEPPLPTSNERVLPAPSDNNRWAAPVAAVAKVTRSHLPGRDDVARVVQTAADLAGPAAVAGPPIDPTSHPKDQYIAKLIDALRATSRTLQSVYVAAVNDRRAHVDSLQSMQESATAAALFASRAGEACDTTHFSRREGARTPAAQHSVARLDPTEGALVNASAVVVSPSNASLLFAARHATRSAARLAEAVAAQEQLRNHDRAVAASRLDSSSAAIGAECYENTLGAVDKHGPRPKSAGVRRTATPATARPTSASSHYDVHSHVDPTRQQSAFEVHTGPTSLLTPYAREEDPHLRRFLARRRRPDTASSATAATTIRYAAKSKLSTATSGKTAAGTRHADAYTGGAADGSGVTAVESEPVAPHLDAPEIADLTL